MVVTLDFLNLYTSNTRTLHNAFLVHILGLSLFRTNIDIRVYTESALKTIKYMDIRIFPVYVKNY